MVLYSNHLKGLNLADGSSKIQVKGENPNIAAEAVDVAAEIPAEINQEEVKEGRGITRRLVVKVLGLLGVSALADQITGGKLMESLVDDDKKALEHSEVMAVKIEKKSKEIAHKIESEKGLSEREKIVKTIDYVGAFLFAWGVRDLLPKHHLIPGGHGHIHSVHYGALLALSALKYQFSDEHGRHHLKEETVSNAKAFGIISGTIIAADGLNMDIEKAYELEVGKKPSKKDQVALMTMMASALSPLATTVGSAGIISNMSNNLCAGDKRLMALCVSHISNLSGFLLFGDPPFIAVCEKYGFKQGIEWQMKTMWPLAIFSLFNSTYKINQILAENSGLSKDAAKKKALTDTVSGLVENVPVLAKMAAASLRNAVKYFSGADISSKLAQDQRGIEVKIGEILEKRITNLAKLPFSAEFDKSTHEAHEGLIRDEEEILEAGDLVEDLEITDGQAAMNQNFKVPDGTFFSQMLSGFNDAENASAESEKWKLDPFQIYSKATDVSRIKEALGHNLGDVINVFPFQAGCVPFLTTVFKDVVNGIDGVDENLKEAILFMMILVFSMFADNYVACKIGLELFPNKPQIPLIAAIQGGSMTAIGNMANVAQFSLDKFSLVDSKNTMGIHLTPAIASFAYSKALTIMSDLGLVTVPKPLKEKEEKKAEDPQQARDMTRRDFFSKFRGGTA